jgi:hypothetical protein
VLVVAVLCIFIGAIAFVAALTYLAGSDYPTWTGPQRVDILTVVKVVNLADSLVTLVCGLNFLHGANWARWLFTVDGIVCSALYVWLASDNLNFFVTTFVFRAICMVILFLPASNRFFLFHERKGR